MSSWDTHDKKNDNSFYKKCSEWIQSGCPLGSNMLINTCPIYKRKPSNNNYRQNRERKGRKDSSIPSQRMIGMININCFHNYLSKWADRDIVLSFSDFFPFLSIQFGSRAFSLWIDVTCIGKWAEASLDGTDNLRDNSAKNTETWDAYEDDTPKKSRNAQQLTNLVVRGSNGISYCIQYRDQSHQIVQPETPKPSNNTKQNLKHIQNKLQINIFAKECPIINNDVFGDHDDYSTKSKIKPNRELLSSYFTYMGPCQAALTDAASVSQAPSSCMISHFRDMIFVILVNILKSTWPILYIFYPHEAS